ncbi:MAG: acetyl-CoA carboxylase biotin carboxylase subunit [Candidatus Eisenbacteria bacterium]|uniref:Acetyl-CoA carboxylase biotin carboxylase subunit n=1 Tax=Eiseniibacteriota bacterium TaxID=2212470 RepID=A0A849SGC4_UNCEI|nr:acetyl-CoA carboxylase biotin carboxylase subunit [Candidatus Eisenbacteria bacterium]
MSPARFKRVLIANRGEIAVRVIRTLRELDITSVAIFSEPDRESLHVLLADEAYGVGAGPARESYLNLERVLETAKRVRADAIHPGYGFFAENAEFARACAAAGITFIGPSPETIDGLGDKLAARAAAAAAGVPMVPASRGAVDSLVAAAEAAGAIGFPVMLKAAAGGGGKGMRVVRSADELSAAWEVTRGEARSAFGDERVYLERFVERPRHVEAQILADADGRVHFLGERECSVQRRHQKLLEETPSPAFDAKTRAAFGAAACKVAKQVGYRNAGTVEFILDEQGCFYFLEVNTRLQVEHPVTEMVTGLDLVAEQIRVAEGRAPSFGDQPPEPRGWSMEARIIAEDPSRNFLPSVGRIERLRLPQGPGVRNDAGIYRGYTVPMFYDSLLSKLIVWGSDREQARRRLLRAIDEFVLDGPRHNLTFHRWLASHPEFVAGRLSTRFLDEHFSAASLAPSAADLEVATVAAALHAREERLAVGLPERDGVESSSVRSAWRWGAPATRGRTR